MRRRLPLILALALVAVVALLWVPPALAGPTVDCGPIDQATCDETWPRVVAARPGLVRLLPIPGHACAAGPRRVW
jgi:hypothetical protein